MSSWRDVPARHSLPPEIAAATSRSSWAADLRRIEHEAREAGHLTLAYLVERAASEAELMERRAREDEAIRAARDEDLWKPSA